MRHRPVRQRWALALLRATRGADLTRLKAFIDDGGRAAAPPACSAAALPSKEIDISVTIGALMVIGAPLRQRMLAPVKGWFKRAVGRASAPSVWPAP